jgi:hypothetical protein
MRFLDAPFFRVGLPMFLSLLTSTFLVEHFRRNNFVKQKLKTRKTVKTVAEELEVRAIW